MVSRSVLAHAVGCFLGVVMATAAAEPEPRGRIHFDYAVHDSDQTELADGQLLRRARLGLSGRADENWKYKSEVDFSGNDVSFQDVYMQYTGLETGALKLGHFKIPFGMDNLTSSNEIPLMERSLPTSFAPGRGVGAGYSVEGNSLGFSAALVGQGIGSNAARAASGGDEGLRLGARLYAPLIATDSTIFHLGAAATLEETASSEDETVRFRARPESKVSGVRLVDTNDLGNRDGVSRFALESAWQVGALTLQGEYMAVQAPGKDGAADYDFDGYYGQASYVLNGAGRPYEGGTFGSPGTGAWEVALRLSGINLNDGAVQGGEEDNISLGVNYYPVDNVRFMANFITVDSERAGVSDDPSMLTFRAQVSF